MVGNRARIANKAAGPGRRAGDAAAAALAQAQHGVISRAQALACGISSAAIERRVAAGRWLRLRPGVYAFAGTPKTRKRDLVEACLAAGPDAVVRGVTAAELWEMDEVWPRTKPHVALGRKTRRRPAGVAIRRTNLAEDRQVLDGVPVTSPIRTIIDLAHLLPEAKLELVVMDAVRRELIDPDALVEAVAGLRGNGRKGIEKLRNVLRSKNYLVTHQSRLEARALQAMVRGGLPRPTGNYQVIEDDEPLGEVDFAYVPLKVGIQLDGEKFHQVTQRQRDDAARTLRMTRAGWQILRFRWKDVVPDPTAMLHKIADAVRARSARLRKPPGDLREPR